MLLFYEAFNNAQNTKKKNDSCILKFIIKQRMLNISYNKLITI